MTTWTNPTDWGFFASNKVKLTRVLFHDNDIKVRQQGGWGNGQPNMAIELWNSEPADCEIYHNRINACVSLVEGGKAPKTIRVHHNLFILEPGYTYAIEAGHHNMEIDHNVFRNGFYPIASFGRTIDNLRIHHNTFDGIEDHGVCNMPGVDEIFLHPQHGGREKGHERPEHRRKITNPVPSRNITITHNLFVKEGAPALRRSDHETAGRHPVRRQFPSGTTPSGTGRRRAARRRSWIPCWSALKDGDQLLRLSAKSPVRAAAKGNIEDDVKVGK